MKWSSDEKARLNGVGGHPEHREDNVQFENCRKKLDDSSVSHRPMFKLLLQVFLFPSFFGLLSPENCIPKAMIWVGESVLQGSH